MRIPLPFLLSNWVSGKNIFTTCNHHPVRRLENLSVDLISNEMYLQTSDFQTIDKTELPDRQKLVRMLFAGPHPTQVRSQSPDRNQSWSSQSPAPPARLTQSLDCLLKSSLWSIVQLKPNSDKKLKEIDRQDHLKWFCPHGHSSSFS